MDIKVENALLTRALGYTYVEVIEDFGTVSKRVTKTVLPDTTAQIFWLKNRRPDKWRDRPEPTGDSEHLKEAKKLLEDVKSAID